MVSDHPQIDYWYKVLQFEILFIQFLRSQHQQDFVPYVESLGKFIPWMFTLDHYDNARGMTVHVQDLLTPQEHLSYYNLNGNFVTQKSSHEFSVLAHDQIHDQAMVKGDGGVIGITENEIAWKGWMVAGPEILNEYDDKHSMNKDTEHHHDQIPSVQNSFLSNVKSVTDVVEQLCIPFSDTSTYLYTLHTKVTMPDSVVHTIRTA